MIVTLYRRDVTLWVSEAYAVRWSNWSFGPPLPYEARRRPQGCLLERLATVEVPVRAPIGSKVVGALLQTHYDPIGQDATTVAYMATRGSRGFSLVPGQELQGGDHSVGRGCDSPAVPPDPSGSHRDPAFTLRAED